MTLLCSDPQCSEHTTISKLLIPSVCRMAHEGITLALRIMTQTGLQKRDAVLICYIMSVMVVSYPVNQVFFVHCKCDSGTAKVLIFIELYMCFLFIYFILIFTFYIGI